MCMCIFIASFSLLLPEPEIEAKSVRYFLVPLLQGLAVALGRNGPAHIIHDNKQLAKAEVIEILAEIASRSGLDTSGDQTALQDLERLAERDLQDPSLKAAYKTEKAWIVQELRDRWRREKRGEVQSIDSLWRSIVALRSELRQDFIAKCGSSFFVERESIFLDLARLPRSHGDLLDLLGRL